MENKLLFPIFDDDWEITTLGEICARFDGNIQTGPFGSQLHASDYVSVGIPSIMPQNITNDRISIEDISCISETDAQKLNRYLVQPGDIVYSRRGDVKRRALVTERESGWLCGTGCLRIRFDVARIESRYIYFYLGHPQVSQWIVQHAVGATMPNLNTNILSNVPCILPPLPEQRAIARILGSLDDKIELNRRQNVTLEALARAIFKSWFVDFDPVRAKAAGHAPDAMDAATAALFPDGFEVVDGREVPRGWRVTPLETEVGIAKGLSYKGSGLDDHDGLAMHNLNSIFEGGGYKYAGIKRYTGEYQERHIVVPGDLIVANTEQTFDFLLIGCPAIIPRKFGQRGLFSHHLFRMRPKTTSYLTSHFLFLQLMSQRLRDEVVGYSNGTTVNMLPSEALQRPKIVIPPEPLVRQFQSIVLPVFKKEEHMIEENENLTALRDALLPKLLSGELRVREAEQVVEDAL